MVAYPHISSNGHVVHECPKKCGPHVTRTIFVTNPQPEELENTHVQS
jgi:hypothetical protein